MAARAKCIRELWYCVEYRDGTRFKECFGRGPNAKGMAQEAAERVNLERAMEKRGLLRTSTGTRFDAYAEEWLRDVIEPHKKSGTVRLYKQLFRDHLKPHFGHLALSEITAREIKAFIAAKLRELRKRDADDVGRARARYTVRNMVAVLRTILYHAVDVDELLPTNPAAKFGKKFFEGSSTDAGIHVEVYEEAEVAKILKVAAKDFPAYELYLRTLFYTGLRLGELLGLQWPDFDWAAGVVSIRRKVKVEKGQLVIERPKSGKFRDVDLAESLVPRWREVESIRAAEAAVAGRAPSPWCCPSLRNPNHRPLNMSWFNARVWARVLKKAELRRLRVHDTRHTYAALMLRQAKPMEYVQAQLGHAKIDTTIRFYGHFKPGVSRHYATDFAARIEAYEERAE